MPSNHRFTLVRILQHGRRGQALGQARVRGRSSTRAALIAAALVGVGVVAAGCTGGQGSPASTPAGAAAAGTSAQPPAAVAAPSATATASRAANEAALTAKALGYAQAAATAASQAAEAAQQAQGLVATAQAAFRQVQSLAPPALARRPSATDPRGALAPLSAAAGGVTAAVSTVRQALASATSAATAAQQIASGDPDAQQAASDASAALRGAQAALQGVEGGASQVSSWTRRAQTAVTGWEQVHNKPPGNFGMEFTDPPSDWTVHGCEVITANPGSPASQAGLIGRDQRTDPVGDVITSITDRADADTTWAVPNCAALQSAISQTRAGDQVTLDYYHRQVVLLLGHWVAASGTASLTDGSNPACPPALTGTITPARAGNRIQLEVNLSGPAGSRPGLDVILDTGGVDTIFPDALLRSLGYRPYGSGPGGGVVPGATDTEYYYHVPAGAITVLDKGAYVPLATGTLTVIGIPGGTDYGLGPDILKHGAKFSTAGSRWTLEPPCG